MLSLLAFLAAIPVSLVVGFRLCWKFSAVQQLGGLLTLKPFLAIPLWSMLVSSVEWGKIGSLGYLWSALPGAGLTLLIALFFHKTIFARDDDAQLAWLLLVLDTVRWGSTLVAFFLPAPQQGLVFLFSLAMPLVFAVATWALCEFRY